MSLSERRKPVSKVCMFITLLVLLPKQLHSFTFHRIPKRLGREIFMCNKRSSDKEGKDLDDLFSQLEDDAPNELSPESKAQLEDTIRRNAPSDLEVRMKMLGITPLTIAGFILAGVMLTLNAVLGNGWLGDLLGIGDNIISAEFADSRALPAPLPGDNRIVITTLRLNQPENLLK